ncbi:cement protein [Phage DSL-LC04]|jgi:hypothetical protein|nr:cement protein [Phage DSL-LC04]
MATTTFSGPVKAGTIRNTTGTTVGTDVANVGYVLMAQSAVIDIIGASANDQVVATVPANSQIVDVILNVTVVNNDTGTAAVTVGTSGDADAFIPSTSVKTAATTRGTLDTEATNVGVTDLQVLVDFTAQNGNGTTGAATVTVLYIQNNNLS